MPFLQKTKTLHLFLSTLSLRRATSAWLLRPAGRSDFYPRSPCGERPLAKAIDCFPNGFLSTLSLRRATYLCRTGSGAHVISIHALLAESDLGRQYANALVHISIHALLAESDAPCPAGSSLYSSFLSTLSLRRATPAAGVSIRGLCNFYPRSPCGERLADKQQTTVSVGISIHALLAESDDLDNAYIRMGTISIHALLAESDTWSPTYLQALIISIHALLAESDQQPPGENLQKEISIHALLAESDSTVSVCTPSSSLFLSTLSLRRATEACPRRKTHIPRFLSTLSLRRATAAQSVRRISGADFYPRSPCGERRFALRVCVAFAQFLSTLSLRRATVQLHAVGAVMPISIHALLAESDSLHALVYALHHIFLSTLSLRRATTRNRTPRRAMWTFLSTLSLRRATAAANHKGRLRGNFYPRSPCGERLFGLDRKQRGNGNFYPRSPCGERPHAGF